MSPQKKIEGGTAGPNCDPLEFYQGLIAKFGIELDGRKMPLGSSAASNYGGLFYQWEGRPLSQSNSYYLIVIKYGHWMRAGLPIGEFLNAMNHRFPSGLSKKDFSHLKHPVSVFGDFWKGMDISFIHSRSLHGKPESLDTIFDTAYRQVLEIQCFWDEFYLAHNEVYINRAGPTDIFADFPDERFADGRPKFPLIHDSITHSFEMKQPARGAIEYDFRPFLHRSLEYLAGVPREQWHDPQQYLNPQTDVSKQLLDQTVSLLFQGEEREQLSAQLAALALRRGFPSIPSLNLGPITMPSPGMQSAPAEYLAQGGALLIEALAPTLGRDDARALVEHRLLNYFLHSTGFQRSRQAAQDVMASISRQVGAGGAA